MGFHTIVVVSACALKSRGKIEAQIKLGLWELVKCAENRYSQPHKKDTAFFLLKAMVLMLL